MITAINAMVLGYLLLQSLLVLRQAAAMTAGLLLSLLLTALLSVLALLSFLIIRRRIVEPIRRLMHESQQIQQDLGRGFLSGGGSDEIGTLADGFNRVLRTMRQAMDGLDRSRRDLLDAQRQIEESLRYAGLLQQAVLPHQELNACFGLDHYLVWLPQQRVGGDFFLIHRCDQMVLVGVADCAGHGVAGAMMTMMARAGVDHAIHAVGLASPAALLAATDRELRNLLGSAEAARSLATSMDMGLLLIDPQQRRLRFAGARLGLHWSDGTAIQMLRCGRRSLGEGQPGSFIDHDIPLDPSATYTLCTDGLIDQSGGADGFGLGRQRLERWLLELAPFPCSEQHRLLMERLRHYQGDEPQRDDITLIALRLRQGFDGA